MPRRQAPRQRNKRSRAPETALPIAVSAERSGLDARSLLAGFASHLKFSLAKDRYSATAHDRFLALAYAVRDRLMERWIETQQTYHQRNVKRVYYLSLEFLMGRSLLSNLVNLGVDAACRHDGRADAS